MNEHSARLLPILLVMAMIFALVGCAPEQAQDTAAVPEETSEVVAGTEAEEPAPTEPAPTEPAPTEPAPTEPAPTESAAVDDEPVILRVGTTDTVDCWNPFACFAAWGFGFLTYEGFTDHGPDPGCPGTPRLAESWEMSEDGMTATIHLHEGITFSDGTPFTAQTAVDYINWFNSTELVYWFAETNNMESVEALDDTTLQYTTSVPILNSADYDWQWWYFGPPSVWGELDDSTLYSYENYPPVTTGAYVVSDYEPGSYVVYDARDDYYRGKPPIDRVVIQMYANVEALVSAFLAGEIDMTSAQMPPDYYDVLVAAPGAQVLETPPGGVHDMMFNVHEAGIRHPAIGDVEVRKAIDYAIDKQQLVDVLLLGHGIPCPNAWACGPNYEGEIDPSLEPTPFDLDMANQILDDAGYLDTDGDGVRETPDGQPLEFRMLFQVEVPLQVSIVDILTPWFEEIGITLIPEGLDLGTWMLAVSENRDFDMALWFSSPDMDPASIDFRGSCWAADTTQSWTGYCNEEVDNLVYEFWYSDDLEARWEPMYKAQRIIAEERPSIVLAGQNNIQAYDTDRFEFPLNACNSSDGMYSPWALLRAEVK